VTDAGKGKQAPTQTEYGTASWWLRNPPDISMVIADA
jgi:hypothetical protein